MGLGEPQVPAGRGDRAWPGAAPPSLLLHVETTPGLSPASNEEMNWLETAPSIMDSTGAGALYQVSVCDYHSKK